MPFIEEKLTIWTAARKGLSEEVKRFVTSGIGIDSRAKGGVTPLHEAAEAGQLEVTNWLLDSGSNINARTDSQRGYAGAQSALYLAVSSGKFNVVKLLLDRGADPNLKSSDTMSPLGEAATNRDFDLVRLLVEYRAKVNSGGDFPPVLLALLARHMDIVEFLFASGASIDTKTIPHRGSLLMDVASARFLAGIDLLIGKGLDVNAQDGALATALHYAVLSFACRTTTTKRNEKGERVVTTDNPEDAIPVVRRLLDAGADQSIRDRNGFTPLDYAKKIRAQPLISLLAPIATPK